MRQKLLFAAAFVGFVAAMIAAWVYGIQQQPQPPVFKPASNPYAQGVYAEGGCIDATRERVRWVRPGHCDIVLPDFPGAARALSIAA